MSTNTALLQRMYDELPQELGKTYLLIGGSYCAVGFALHLAGIPDDLLVGKCCTLRDDREAFRVLANILGISESDVDSLSDANDNLNDPAERYQAARTWIKGQLELAALQLGGAANE